MKRKSGADLSVRASRDGHEFHEAWAARKALQLVFPRDKFVAMAIESLSPDDQGDASDASTEIADLVLYYGAGPSFALADQVVVVQFKYSVGNKATPFRHSDAKKTLAKFAAAFKDYRQRYSAREVSRKLRFELVTNRPISPALAAALRALAVGGSATGDLKRNIEKLHSICGLSSPDLVEFSKRVTVIGSTGSLGETKLALSNAVVDWSRGRDATAYARLGALRQLVRDKAGTAGSGNNTILRAHVFVALGVQGEETLLPTPSAFPNVGKVVERAQLRKVAETIPALSKPLIIHAAGGAGKTVFMQSLASVLGKTHRTLLFDCFGGGQYRAPEDVRHRPDRGLLHVVNSLALEGICDPLLPDSDNMPETIRACRRRFEQAVETMRRVSPGTLLLLFLDAIDNAAIIAKDRKEESFPRLLLESFAINGLPEGVKLIVSCRSERRALAKGAAKCEEERLEPFNHAEANDYLRARIPDISDVKVNVAYARSGGNPRILEYLVRGGESLLNRSEIGGPIELDDLLKDQIRSALDDATSRGYSDSDVAAFLAGLSVLPPPVPLAEYADAQGMELSEIESFAADLFPLIEHTKQGLVFRDEPTETYIRDNYAANLDALRRVAENLTRKQEQSVYAASALPYLLQVTGSADQLFNLAFDERFPASITSDVGRRNIRDARLKAAIKHATHRGDYNQLIRLLVELSTIAAVNQRGADLLVGHPGLVIASQDTDALRRLFQVRTKWPGTRHARIAIANALAGAFDEADRHCASAFEWIYHYQTLSEAERADIGGPKPIDVACVPFCLIARGRAKRAADYIGRYFDWFAHDVSKHMFESLNQGELAGTIPREKADAFLSRLKREVGVLAGALSFAKLTEQKRVLLIRSLARASSRKKKLKESAWAGYDDSFKLSLQRAVGLALARGLDREAAAILTCVRLGPPPIWSFLSRYSRGSGTAYVIRATLAAVARNRTVSERDLLPEQLRDVSLRVKKGLHGTSYRAALLAGVEARCKVQRQESTVKQRDISHETKREMERFINQRLERLTRLVRCFEAVVAARRGKADRPFQALVDVWLELGKRTDEYSDQQSGAHEFGEMGLQLVLFALSTRQDLKVGSVAATVPRILESPSVTTSTLIDITATLARRPALQSTAGSMALIVSQRVNKEDDVETRAELFASLAHAVLPANSLEAASYFRRGLQQLDAIGAGDWQFTNELLLFAHSLRDQQLSPAEYHTLSNVCELNMGEERKFPWDAFAKGATSVAGLPMLAKLGRWADRDKISLGFTLLPYLTALISRKKIGPENALGLMQLADPVELYTCDTGDFALALRANRYANEAMLLREVIRQFLEDNPNVPSRSVLEKLRLLAKDILGAESLESKCLEWLSPQAESLIREQNERNNFRRDHESVRRKAHRERQAETRGMRAALRRIAERTDPLRDVSLAEAIEAMNALGAAYEFKGEFFSHLRKRVRYADRGCYVQAIARLDNLLIYWKFEELNQCKAEWGSSSASINDVLRDLAMEMVQDNIDELVSRDSLSSYLLKQISDLSGISMPELSLEVVRLFANPDSHISSAVWLSLAGIVAEKADQAEGLAALRRLLTGNAVRLAGMVADGGFSPELYPDANEVDVCAGLVWLQLGSPSSIDRWRAAHSLRRFARLDQWDVIDSVVTRSNASGAGPFQAQELPFYSMHARLWLVIALARMALEYPGNVARYEDVLKAIALNDEVPHVVMRQFAADALISCKKGGHSRLTSGELARIHKVNVSQFGPPQKTDRRGAGYYEGRPVSAPEPENKFWLDMDFEKQTVEGLARVFGLPHWQVTDVVNEWIRRFDKKVEHMYDSGGRSRKQTERQVGLIPEYQGYGQQLGWHAVWLAAGQLLVSNPIVVSGFSEPGQDPWMDWLQDFLLSRKDGLWLADGTDSPPVEVRSSLQETGKRAVVLTGDKAKLLRLVGIEGGRLGQEIVVEGDWKSVDGIRVAISSALVKPEDADRRMRGLLRTRPVDVWLPTFDQRVGIAEWLSNARTGYQPWVVSPSDEVRLDADDPLGARHAAVRRPYLSTDLRARLLLTSADAFNRRWLDTRGRCIAHAEAWGRDQPYLDDGSRTGKRLVLSTKLLRKALETAARSLLVLIRIERYQSERYSSEDSGFFYTVAVCRITPDLNLRAAVGKVNYHLVTRYN